MIKAIRNKHNNYVFPTLCPRIDEITSIVGTNTFPELIDVNSNTRFINPYIEKSNAVKPHNR